MQDPSTSPNPIQSPDPTIRYRSLVGHGDLPRLQVLHDASFPIRYYDSFYESLLVSNSSYTTLVAVCDAATYWRMAMSAGEELLDEPTTVLDDASGENEAAHPQSNNGSGAAGSVGGEASLPAESQMEIREAVSMMLFTQRKEQAQRQQWEAEAKLDPRGPAAAQLQQEAEAEAAKKKKKRPGAPTSLANPNHDDKRHYGSGVPNEVIIGFIVARVKHNDAVVMGLMSEPVCYISTFGVHPAFRRRGIGDELFERMVATFLTFRGDKLKNPDPPIGTWLVDGVSSLFANNKKKNSNGDDAERITEVWLHVWAANSGAIGFYKKHQGFEEVQYLRDYYNFHNATHDAMLLKKKLVKGDEDRTGSSTSSLLGGLWRSMMNSSATSGSQKNVASKKYAALEVESDDEARVRKSASGEASTTTPQQRRREEEDPSPLTALRNFLLAGVIVFVLVGILAGAVVGSFHFAQWVAPPPPLPK